MSLSTCYLQSAARAGGVRCRFVVGGSPGPPVLSRPLTRRSPTALPPSLQMRSLFAQRRVITMPRIHHSVIAVDPEQLAADVAQ